MQTQIYLTANAKIRYQYLNSNALWEKHRVYDFTISANDLPETGEAVRLVFDLVTQGIGPLHERLVRASLLSAGTLICDIGWDESRGRFSVPLTRTQEPDRTEFVRLDFDVNALIPLKHLFHQFTIRIVTNNRLGNTYYMVAYASQCKQLTEGVFSLKLKGTNYDSTFIVNECRQFVCNTPGPMKTWQPERSGPVTCMCTNRPNNTGGDRRFKPPPMPYQQQQQQMPTSLLLSKNVAPTEAYSP